LNEAQQQKQKIAAQATEIHDLKKQVAELNNLKQEMHSALTELKLKGQLVAKR
jgi:cell division protein FtsL